jgi:predicted PurR-regulated permease PerM
MDNKLFAFLAIVCSIIMLFVAKHLLGETIAIILTMILVIFGLALAIVAFHDNQQKRILLFVKEHDRYIVEAVSGKASSFADDLKQINKMISQVNSMRIEDGDSVIPVERRITAHVEDGEYRIIRG